MSAEKVIFDSDESDIDCSGDTANLSAQILYSKNNVKEYEAFKEDGISFLRAKGPSQPSSGLFMWA